MDLPTANMQHSPSSASEEKDYPEKVADTEQPHATTVHLQDVPSNNRNNPGPAPETLPGAKERKWWHSIKEPGSAIQIVLSAAIALGIGLGVSSTHEVPSEATTLLAIPGNLWLRALTCVVLPLIVCSIILSVQRLKEISNGGHLLARWTIGYYVATTLCAILVSTLLTGLLWNTLFSEVSGDMLQVNEADQEEVDDRQAVGIDEVVVDMFNSLIPRNIVDALANNELLSVLVASVVIGYLVQGPESIILKLAHEIERIITIIIGFLIKLAPVGVFFLVLSAIMELDIAELGANLGILIGGTLCNLAIHLFVVLPLIFLVVTRRNPYSYWIKNSPAWVTAWGTASSAATLPVTLKMVKARGVPVTVYKFATPLGTLVNMDGTAIYFPLAVQFLAQTQGITLNAANYVILILLSTLASIGTTPIPSASLVLIVMICGSVDVPITGMYSLIVAVDWLLDRFRTMINVSGDMYGAMVIYKLSKMEDPPGYVDEDDETTVQEGSEELQRQRTAERV